MKSRASLVDHGFISSQRTQSLRLLFIENCLSEITGIPVVHAGHVIDFGTTRTESDRLLTSGGRVVMATLKCPDVTADHVRLAAVRICCVGPICTFQSSLISSRLILF